MPLPLPFLLSAAAALEHPEQRREMMILFLLCALPPNSTPTTTHTHAPSEPPFFFYLAFCFLLPLPRHGFLFSLPRNAQHLRPPPDRQRRRRETGGLRRRHKPLAAAVALRVCARTLLVTTTTTTHQPTTPTTPSPPISPFCMHAICFESARTLCLPACLLFLAARAHSHTCCLFLFAAWLVNHHHTNPRREWSCRCCSLAGGSGGISAGGSGGISGSASQAGGAAHAVCFKKAPQDAFTSSPQLTKMHSGAAVVGVSRARVSVVFVSLCLFVSFERRRCSCCCCRAAPAAMPQQQPPCSRGRRASSSATTADSARRPGAVSPPTLPRKMPKHSKHKNWSLD